MVITKIFFGVYCDNILYDKMAYDLVKYEHSNNMSMNMTKWDCFNPLSEIFSGRQNKFVLV